MRRRVPREAAGGFLVLRPNGPCCISKQQALRKHTTGIGHIPGVLGIILAFQACQQMILSKENGLHSSTM
ncbi:hypothetical protein A0H81_10433 [Grifola frondosa]|uniref:Uncharacterized protein n=1 Tax=Grifola frondosa TaxID=5627 RepID=A0A1C7LZL4_GRIFR|nr:hypothetical protein A0H81_10433 [Grifola frondosa]